MFDPATLPLDAESAFRHYEAARQRLPVTTFPAGATRVSALVDLADDFDAFVLDAFGVLVVGTSTVPRAPETVAALQAAGKAVIVLTNGASFPRAKALARYRSLGFHLELDNIVASREAARIAIAARPPETVWGVSNIDGSEIETLTPNVVSLEDDDDAYDRADAFLLLSALNFTFERHKRLIDTLSRRPRPVMVANPDIVAPHEDRFSLEPGFFAHDIADRTGIEPEFHGKPFPSAFDIVKTRLPADIRPERIAMVGDTLHTDILGGAAAGWRTVLISGHGLFRGHDVDHYVERSGIVPDFITETV